MDRGERRRRTESVLRRRIRQFREISYYEDLPRARWFPGRFKKHSPFDCGHTRCWLCSNRKLGNNGSRYLTMQELSAELKVKEDF